MEFERMPRITLERAQELAEMAGGLLEPETAVMLALREADKLPVPAPGVHQDLQLGMYGELALRGALPGDPRAWSAVHGERAWKIRFEEGVPGWAADGVTMAFIGGERVAAVPDLITLPPGALVVPTSLATRLDPSTLEPGMNDLTLEGVLVGMTDTRTFHKRSTGGMGFVRDVVVRTEGAEVQVTLWDDMVKPVVDAQIGARIRFTGLYTKERNGAVQVQTGRSATIELLD